MWVRLLEKRFFSLTDAAPWISAKLGLGLVLKSVALRVYTRLDRYTD